MIWIRLRLAVFLCPGLKNRVCSVSHRLGSFGRIGLFAGVLFQKKDEKRDGGNPGNPLLVSAAAETIATPFVHRLGSFGRIRLFADVLFHKKDQKRDGEIGTVIGSRVASTSDAQRVTQGLKPLGFGKGILDRDGWDSRFGPFLKRAIANQLIRALFPFWVKDTAMSLIRRLKRIWPSLTWNRWRQVAGIELSPNFRNIKRASRES